jgi:hypothetical protein
VNCRRTFLSRLPAQRSQRKQTSQKSKLLRIALSLRLSLSSPHHVETDCGSGSGGHLADLPCGCEYCSAAIDASLTGADDGTRWPTNCSSAWSDGRSQCRNKSSTNLGRDSKRSTSKQFYNLHNTTSQMCQWALCPSQQLYASKAQVFWQMSRRLRQTNQF